MIPFGIFLVVWVLLVFGVLGWLVWRRYFWVQPESRLKDSPKGWDEHKEIRKGKYRIVIDECEGYGSAYFGETSLVRFSKMEECVRICEEHRLKEEVKKEMEAEYGLEKNERRFEKTET